MIKRLFKLFILSIILAVIVCNYETVTEYISSKDPDNRVIVESKTETATIDIIYDMTVPTEAIEEVKTSLLNFPAAMIRSFVKDEWKIIVTRDMENETVDGIILGYTDYPNRTIKVFYSDEHAGITGRTVIHEFCHYADAYFGDPSGTDEFWKLYEEYKEDYIPFFYDGIQVTDDNRDSIKYAVSDQYEFFAFTLADYMVHRRYIEDRYPDIFKYYERKVVL